MSQTHHKAILLTHFWAGILGTLLTACIIGGVGFAWNAHSETAVLQADVQTMKDAKLPSRLDKLEVKVDGIKEDIQDVRDSQREMVNKLDQVLSERRRAEGPPR